MAPDPVAELLAAYPVLHHALRQTRQTAPDGGVVSAHQATALAHLDPVTGRTVSELAAEMGVAMPTMSLLADRLVRAGLIHRERDPADGRRVVLRLTRAGAHVVATRSLLDPDRVRALLALLSPREQAAGVRGLTTLARAARQLGSRTDPSPPSSTRGRS